MYHGAITNEEVLNGIEDNQKNEVIHKVKEVSMKLVVVEREELLAN